jgi:hypothetical protein
MWDSEMKSWWRSRPAAFFVENIGHHTSRNRRSKYELWFGFFCTRRTSCTLRKTYRFTTLCNLYRYIFIYPKLKGLALVYWLHSSFFFFNFLLKFIFSITILYYCIPFPFIYRGRAYTILWQQQLWYAGPIPYNLIVTTTWIYRSYAIQSYGNNNVDMPVLYNTIL